MSRSESTYVDSTGAMFVAYFLDGVVISFTPYLITAVALFASGTPISDIPLKSMFVGGEHPGELILGYASDFSFLFYLIVVPLKLRGTTIAFHMFGFSFVQENGEPPGTLRIILRGVFLPLILGIGIYIKMFTRDRFKFDPFFGLEIIRTGKQGS